MNYLVHLYLAEPTPDSRLGALMGDFIKGRLPGDLSPGLREGVVRHRRTDLFAHDSEDFRRSKRRLDESFGLCKPILIDIFYDHFMALRWSRYSPLPLEEFAQGIYRLLQERHAELPPGLQQIAPRMIAHDWLVSYRDRETIGTVLERISRRLSRPTLLAEGLRELERHFPELEDDFHHFIRQAGRFLRTDPRP